MFDMRTLIAVIVIVGIFGRAFLTNAQMSSTNYEIRWDTIGAGGDDTSSSASYTIRDTLGNVAIGPSSSASYGLRAGYRQGVDDSFIEFSLLSQSHSVVSQATGLVGTTVSCDPTNFSVGQMVVLTQDRGAAEVSAIGRITSVGVADITVDSLTDNGTAPVIDGANDYLHLLNGTSAVLQDLSAALVRTVVVGMEITSDGQDGYVVQVAANGDLSAGAATISPVGDGSVTAGSEEYGARSSDSTLAGSTFESADTAFTTSFQDVFDSADEGYEDRAFLTLKASIDALTDNGNYTQSLTVIVSATY